LSGLLNVQRDFCFEETFSGLSGSSVSFSQDSPFSLYARDPTVAMTSGAKRWTIGIPGGRGDFFKNPVSKFFRLQVLDISHFHQIKICKNLENPNLWRRQVIGLYRNVE
jgi:hypothetical protein